ELFDPNDLWSDVPTPLFDATLLERLSFGNRLTSVRRSKALPPAAVGSEPQTWLAHLPDVRLQQSSDDLITKFRYHPGTQLLVSESDPQHTVSPDPLHVESAPPGTPAYD